MSNHTKIISLILSLIMVISVFGIVPIGISAKEINASAVGATSGITGDCTWTLDGTVLTVSGNGKMGNYSPWGTDITEAVLTEGVTSVGDYVFYNCTSLTSVTIPDSVTCIGDSAFHNCMSLTGVTIPDSVTHIGDRAFYYCTSLMSVNIPDSVTCINVYTFFECKSLTSVSIPDSVTRIDDYSFHDCAGLKSVNIPDSVASIGDNAFSGCTGLTSITIPNSVTSIGWNVFIGCEGLTSVSVSPDNSVYDSRNNCNAIIETKTNKLIVGCQKTIIPNSVTSIETWSFYGCKGLTNIDIPDSVTSIGRRTFAECSGLTSINISNSVTSIGEWAFEGCTGLTSVNIPDHVTSIDESAFEGCAGLTSVTIPDSVKSIGTKAFYGCTGLRSITIPDSVTSIGQRAFAYYSDEEGNRCRDNSFTICGYSNTAAEKYANNNGLSFIELEGTRIGKTGDCTWILDGTVLTITGKGRMESGPWGTNITEVILTDGVTSIGAFSGCKGLTSITIPDSVTYISVSAFEGCTGLTSVTIPDSITSIDEYAFSGCTGLTSVKIGNSVKNIAEEAFRGCTGLTSVTIGNSVKNIGWSSFIDCTRLTSITIPDSVTSISNYAFGYYLTNEDWDWQFNKSDGFTIYGYSGTAAEKYAKKNGFTFIALDDTPKAGDADGDGEITVRDVTEVQHLLSSMNTKSDEATLMFADVDKNGVLEVIDATFILRYLADIEIPYVIG